MVFDNKTLEVGATPWFNAACPKHRNNMKKLDDGWFSLVWWCEECQYPYRIKLVKMTKWDKEEVEKQLQSKK